MKKSLKFCKKSKGFTLVELVIVIAIVIILSVISVPIYRGYIDKSKMSEGYALLGAILSAQKAYYSEHGCFLRRDDASGRGNLTVYDEILGIDARGNKYFTSFVVGTNSLELKKDYFNALSWIPEDLRKGKFSRLVLIYNTTIGSKVFEGDNNWREDATSWL